MSRYSFNNFFMKLTNKFPWWLIFNVTCFLSWLSMLSAGLISKNKTWTILGLIYMIPFILIFTVPNKDETQKISKIKFQLNDTLPFAKSDSVKYSESIIINEEIKGNKNIIDSLIGSGFIYYSPEIEPYTKTQDSLYEELDKSIKKANPEFKPSKYANFVYTLWALITLVAFINSFIIIKKYNILVNEQKSITKRIKTKPIVKELSEEEKILMEIGEIRKRIINRIKKSKDFDSFIENDIKKMVDDYSYQIKKLIEDKKQLEKKIALLEIKELETEIKDLQNKLSKADNPRIIKEYKNSINAKQILIESESEILINYKTIKLRLETSVDSLKQVENDLIKLENVFNVDNKQKFFKTFEEKSAELNNYVNDVEKNFNEL